MSRSFQPKNQTRSCESYINTITELRSKLTATEAMLDIAELSHDNEAKFLVWIIAIAFGLGIVIGAVFSKVIAL